MSKPISKQATCACGMPIDRIEIRCGICFPRPFLPVTAEQEKMLDRVFADWRARYRAR